MAKQAARLLSRRPFAKLWICYGKTDRSRRRAHPTNPCRAHGAPGTNETAGRRTHGLLPKEPAKRMPNGYVLGARRPTGPPDRYADHARRPGFKSSRPKSQHHHARRMVPARLPRPPPTLQRSKARARLPKARKKKAKEDKEAVREKAESLQQVLDDLPDDSPLRPDFEAQLQSLQGQLKDKRSKGARLDSAEARLRRAEASLAKKEQAMEDAATALEEAKQEAEETQKALEEVRATMVPATVVE